LRFHGEHLLIDDLQDEWLACRWPEVDRYSQYREIDSWLSCNPRRRPRLMERFIHRWFARQKRYEINRPNDEVIVDGAKCRRTRSTR
jgi:hypothetical protein